MDREIIKGITSVYRKACRAEIEMFLNKKYKKIQNKFNSCKNESQLLQEKSKFKSFKKDSDDCVDAIYKLIIDYKANLSWVFSITNKSEDYELNKDLSNKTELQETINCWFSSNKIDFQWDNHYNKFKYSIAKKYIIELLKNPSIIIKILLGIILIIAIIYTINFQATICVGDLISDESIKANCPDWILNIKGKIPFEKSAKKVIIYTCGIFSVINIVDAFITIHSKVVDYKDKCFIEFRDSLVLSAGDSIDKGKNEIYDKIKETFTKEESKILKK